MHVAEVCSKSWRDAVLRVTGKLHWSLTHTWLHTGISLGFLVALLICIPLTSNVPRCTTTTTNLQTARTKLYVLWLEQRTEYKWTEAQAGYAEHFYNFNYEFVPFFSFVMVFEDCECAARADYSLLLYTSPTFHHFLHACNIRSCSSLPSHFVTKGCIFTLLLYFFYCNSSFLFYSGRLPYFPVFRFLLLFFSVLHIKQLSH